MKKLICLSLCLSLSLFAVARATKPGQTLTIVAKSDQKERAGKKADAKTLHDVSAEPESFAMSEAEEEEPATGGDTDDGVTSGDNDSAENASDDEGKDTNDDNSGDDEGADDNSGADDNGNDDGGDDGGG